MCILRAFLRREVAIAVVAVPRRGAGEGVRGGRREEAGRGTAAAGFPAKGSRARLRLGRAGELGFPLCVRFPLMNLFF